MYHTTIHDSPPSQLQSNPGNVFFGRIGNQKKGPETNPKKVRCVILRNERPAIPHGQVESKKGNKSAGNAWEELTC